MNGELSMLALNCELMKFKAVTPVAFRDLTLFTSNQHSHDFQNRERTNPSGNRPVVRSSFEGNSSLLTYEKCLKVASLKASLAAA